MRWVALLALFVGAAACGRPESPPSAGPLPLDPSATKAAPAEPFAAMRSVLELLRGHADAGPVDAQVLDSPEVAVRMSELAKATLARMGESADSDAEEALFDRVLVGTAAGDRAGALRSLERLRATAKRFDPAFPPVLYTAFEVYVLAKRAEDASQVPFAHAYSEAFHAVFARLDDLSAEHAMWRPDTDLRAPRDVLLSSADAARRNASPDLASAVAVVARWQEYVVRRDALPLTAPLQTMENLRRYDIDDDAHVTTKDGATLSAIVARPRRPPPQTQPSILFFTIYTDTGMREAIASAAHGYVGVTVYARGKRRSPDAIVPYEHEVKDVKDAIEWSSKLPGASGEVGMYGGSYSGFAQWAATKHKPAALKTIVPYVAAIPGQGLPMENNVFLNANYGWAFYVGNGPYNDDATYYDRARWNALPEKWFASGRPYRELDRVDSAKNPLFQRWIAHPSYDAYWQNMVPFGDDFAKLDIPILSVTGYYDDGQISALRYFTEHTKRDKAAKHYLLIGPWDHFGSQRRPSPVLRGYAIDPVARIDTTFITYQWFDHVFRGGPLPSLVTDKVNWEVMGKNEWRHAPTIEAMTDSRLRLYLDDHHLLATKPDAARFVAQEVDLADRTKKNNDAYYPDPIVTDKLDAGPGLVFESEPFDAPVSIDGLFAGELKVEIDKKDMDVGLSLYEKTPEGKYVHLSYFLGRASYACDMTTRHLLTPGKVETIPVERTRMVSKQLATGSRIVLVVDVNKNDGAQVNHGTGKDVSNESSADAKTPLHVKWFANSFVTVPIRR